MSHIKTLAFPLTLFVALASGQVLYAKPDDGTAPKKKHKKPQPPVEEGDVLGSLVGTQIGELDARPPADVVEVRGALKHAAVQDFLDAQEVAIRRCYGSDRPELTVQFAIGATGKATLTSNLDDPTVDSCLRQAIAGWKFPKPRDGRDVAVTCSINAPVPPVGGIGLVGSGPGGGGTGEGTIGLGNLGHIGKPASADAALVRGSLPKEIIRREIDAHASEVTQCFDAATGRVTVQFTIAGSGQVVAAVVQSSTLGKPHVEQCLASTIKQWTFPKPGGGGIVIVSYPFAR